MLRDNHAEETGKRLFGPLRAVAALTGCLCLVPPWLLLPHRSRPARWMERQFHKRIVSGHGLAVHVHGEPARHGRTLYVANHISWIDIPLLGSIVDAAFVAKDEVGRWPLIGGLARRCGTIFVARHRPALADVQQRALGLHLAANRGVILFPEGTTSDGRGVLPFRTSLFAAAGSGPVSVQPVALVYRRADGGSLSPADRRKIAWLADDDLLPHAMKMAATAGLAVHVHFEPPVRVSDRKLAARLCREAILARLGEDNQAAILNRVA